MSVHRLYKTIFAIGVLSLVITSCGLSGGNSNTTNGNLGSSCDFSFSHSVSSTFSSSDDTIYHTVAWLNYDYSLLYKDSKVVEGDYPVYTGATPTKPSTVEYNYSFSGWSPAIVPAYTDATYVAQFSTNLNTFTVTWKNDDGTILSTSKCEYGYIPYYEGETPIKASTEEHGYVFIGWSPEIAPVYADTTYVAQYSVCYALNVTSQDISRGTASIVSGRGIPGETIVVEAKPAEGCVFKGWYQGTSLIDELAIYSFTMPTGNYALTARFSTQEEEDEYNRTIGIFPIIDSSKRTVSYGLYPQKRIDDPSLVSALNSLTTPKSNGWYLYNEAYYAKTVATPYKLDYTFLDGEPIVNEATYWFKCEPIIWRILNNDNGEYFLLSSVLLDCHMYNPNHYTFGYDDSELRNWLNDYFYNSAFALHDNYVTTTWVCNDSYSTDYNSNASTCEDTEDKVFLLSYREYLSTQSGFSSTISSSKTRECKVTDWAIARGAGYHVNEGYLFNGYYWTRSPFSYYARWYVEIDGRMTQWGTLESKQFSVRPAITFSMTNENY